MARESHCSGAGRRTLHAHGLAGQIAGKGGALDGNGDGIGGDDFVLVGDPATNKLFRLFGDANGDGVVDQSTSASSGPRSIRAPSNYLAFLDANGDGVVDQVDLGQFRSRFNVSI